MYGQGCHILSLLNYCKTLISLKQVQCYGIKLGLNNDPLFSGKLLLHCAITISNAIDYAREIFWQIPRPDVFMYNTLIRGLAESDTPMSSVVLFNEMRRKSVVPPDSFSFAFILKAVAYLRSLQCGAQLHCLTLVHGLNTHLFVGTTLVSMYAECGNIHFARRAFEEICDPNVVAWNAIVTACFRCGDLAGAKVLFDRMPFRNSTSYNVVLAGYAKAGELELARDIFAAMSVKDDVSWSTMIVGFAHNACFDEAFRYFKDLQLSGICPNEVSLTGILSACADAGAFELGKILHGYIEKAGFSQIISVNNALLDTYAKCGNVGMAQLVFERMPERKSIISWTTMIAGLAMYGYGRDAIKLFIEMEDAGIKPDGITFISILYACSHAGLIDEGSAYFSRMRDVYSIEPRIEHYGCIVDLYGRAGKLQMAYEFVCQMPIEPTAIIWRTLLGACSFYSNVELGEHVRERLSELDPHNSGDHVLLSNIYAIAGKWKDVVSTRRSMSDQKIVKTPGWSMIEVDKIMYSFVAGQRYSEIVEEAYEKLAEIMLKLKVEGGYVPQGKSVLHDIEEEEKEDSLSRHSEKLAVAFGIARLSERDTIRVVKNLRICMDCHTFMKLISKLFKLKIVVRDRSRFHYFRDGSCSCLDYW